MTDDLDTLIIEAVGDVRDPYPHFAEMRRANPVAREEGFDGEAVFSVYRYADALAVLKDPRTFSSRHYANAVGVVFGPSFIQMDGAEHHRHRAVIGGSFRRTVLAGLEPTLIEPIVHGLIDGFAARGEADLVRDLTIRFPIRVIAKMLGIPDADDERFTRWSLALIGFANNFERGMEASGALRDYFAAILAERRRAPRDDLISLLARAEVDGAPLPEEEIFGFLRLLLPAGAETTYRLLGSVLLALLRDPDQLALVRADRTLVARAIEEALRWECPIQFISRAATRDVVLGGIEVPAGSQVGLWLGSANHDEAVFADPERFDLHAERAPHLAFAEGPHRCIGEHLARLETTVALNALLDRFPDLRLDPRDRDPHVHGSVFRSPNRVPVLFSPA